MTTIQRARKKQSNCSHRFKKKLLSYTLLRIYERSLDAPITITYCFFGTIQKSHHIDIELDRNHKKLKRVFEALPI